MATKNTKLPKHVACHEQVPDGTLLHTSLPVLHNGQSFIKTQ